MDFTVQKVSGKGAIEKKIEHKHKHKHNETEQTEMRLQIKTEQIYIIRVNKRMSLKCSVWRWKMKDERQTQAQKHKHSVDNQLDLNEWQNERDIDTGARETGTPYNGNDRQQNELCVYKYSRMNYPVVWWNSNTTTNDQTRKSKYMTVKRNQTNETNVN